MNDALTIEILQSEIGRSKFHQLFQPEVLEVNTDLLQLRIKMMMCDTLERQPGTNQWHGGAISAAIDTVGCYALRLVATDLCPTVNFRIDYFRPAINTNLILEAKIRKAGRRICVVDVDVKDDTDHLVAVGRACYANCQPESINFS